MITLQSGIKLVSLPTPVFNDTFNTNLSVVVKKSRNQKVYTYLKGDASKKNFKLTFSGVSRVNYEAFKTFFIDTVTERTTYTDQYGVSRVVRILSDPLTGESTTKGDVFTFSISCQEL